MVRSKNNTSGRPKRIIILILKTVLWIVLLPFILVLVIVISLQLPQAQSFVTHKATDFLGRKLKTKIELQKISINFPESVSLQGLYLEDEKKDTLLYARLIKVDIALWELLSHRIMLNAVKLENITGHVYRDIPGDHFNFSFIPKAFSSENKDTLQDADPGKVWQFGIKTISLRNIYLTYHDKPAGMDADLHLGNFETHINEFDLSRRIIHVQDIYVSDSRGLLSIQGSQVKQPEGSSAGSSPEFDIDLKQLRFSRLDLAYSNNISRQQLKLRLGELAVDADQIDLQKERIALNSVLLHHTNVSFTQYPDLIKDTSRQVATAGKIPGWVLRLKKLDLEDNTIAYDNHNAVPVKNALDVNHLLTKDLTVKARDLYLDQKKATLDLDSLHATEQSGLVLKNLKGRFRFDTTHAEITGLDLQLNNSRITEAFAITYPSLQALKGTPGALGINASFKHTQIALKDLLYFSPDLLEKLPLKEENNNAVVTVSGKIGGSLSDLIFTNFGIQTKTNTLVKVDGSLKNILSPAGLYASVRFVLNSSKQDITSLLKDSILPRDISIPDTLSVKGSFTGYVKNFNADVAVNTSFGDISTQVNMNPWAGNKEQPYVGRLDIHNFNLGKLLNQPQNLGLITMSASVKGEGLDTSRLNAHLSLEIQSAGFRNYDYKNFTLEGQLKKKSFTGQANMNDENLVFDFNGGIDLEPAHPKYTFTLNLNGADLGRLNLSESDLRVSAVIQSDIGNEPGKNATGTAGIRNALIIRNNRKYPVDSIILYSDVKDGVSDLRLRSGILTADLKGGITLKELPGLLRQHINTYFNMQDGIAGQHFKEQKFDFELNVTNPDIITTNFIPELEKLTPISVKGSYDSQAKSIGLNAVIPQVKYSGIAVDSLQFKISSGPKQLNYALTVAEISNPTFRFENIYFGGELKDNNLGFRFNTAKDDSLKLLNIAGLLRSQNTGFELKLDPALVLNSQSWDIEKNNYIHFGKQGLYASDLVLSSGLQSLSVNSREKTPDAPLEIRFKNFGIATVSRLIENKRDLLNGTINGNVILEHRNKATAFRSDLEIRDFTFQGIPVGTIRLNAGNIADPLTYTVKLDIHGNSNDITLSGSYKATQEKQLNMLLGINRLDLKTIEPFTFGQVSKMSGEVRGDLHLKGTVSAPLIDGKLNFREAAFKPRLMDSYLTVHNSDLIFDKSQLRFDNFIISDSLSHEARINGMVDIRDFKSVEMDLRLKTNEFLALNTTKEDNPLYYGKIIIDSDIHVSGTADAPNVDIKAKLNKGSVLTYVKPESQVTRNESKGVVEFINPSDKNISIMARQNDSIDGISRMKGIDMHASINFDKSVQLKMIIDQSTGDSLYVQGGGLLDFGLDRSGKTSLSGKYSISDGGYYLSLENLVKRSFKIQPGSSITWSGDMLDAYLDLTAIYTIKTSPLDLVQNELTGASELEKNKYRNLLTFLVYLKMTGFLSAPEISFDIDLAPSDRGALNGAVNTRLAQLREDETQLNKQVFALLTLRRFIGENPLESSSEGGLSSASRSSASKVLTQQLSSLSDRYVNFVDLDLGVNSFEDYSSGQQQGRTQLQVGVSKQLFNDKVTVRVGGNVDLEGERATQNSANDVAGNISIDYRLTEDGRYKLRAARENQYENPIEGELTKTSAGVIFVRNFNTFRQLFSGPGKKAKLIKPVQESKTDEEK